MGTKQTQNCVGGTKFNFKDWDVTHHLKSVIIIKPTYEIVDMEQP